MAPGDIYDLLLDQATMAVAVDEVVIGRHYLCCRSSATGIAQSPNAVGPCNWEGALAGRSLRDLTGWLRSWDPMQAAIGMAAVNAALNREADMVYEQGALVRGSGARGGIFEWFLPRLRGRRVAVCGGLGGLRPFASHFALDEFPCRGGIDAACEQLLPQAEWVFIADHTLPDKTLPRLLTLARNATVVLAGPAVPWLQELSGYGIDFLVGVEVSDGDALRRIVAEGGDLAAIERTLHYRIAPLGRAGLRRVVA